MPKKKIKTGKKKVAKQVTQYNNEYKINPGKIQ
jgi:hypothetical protein